MIRFQNICDREQVLVNNFWDSVTLSDHMAQPKTSSERAVQIVKS